MSETPEAYEPEHRAEEPVIGDPPPRQNTLFSNAVYDKLKFLAQVVLPAMGALYFGVAEIWGLPNAQEVVGTIVVVDTFLGVVLGYSSAKYEDPREGKLIGFINVKPKPGGGKLYDLEYPGDPEEIDQQDKVTFKVRHF